MWLLNARFLLAFIFSEYMSSLNTPFVVFSVLPDIFLGICPVERIPHLQEVDDKLRSVLKAWMADADPQDDNERLEHHLGRCRVVNCEMWVITKSTTKWRFIVTFQTQTLASMKTLSPGQDKTGSVGPALDNNVLLQNTQIL